MSSFARNAPVADLGSSLDGLAVPPLVRGAGGVVLGAGILAALTAVQALTGFWVSGTLKLVLLALLALGVTTGVAGLMLMRARAWAAIAAIVLSGLLLLATSGWLFLGIAGGLLSLFALAGPVLSFVSLIVSIFALDPCKRTADARAELRAQGLDLGA